MVWLILKPYGTAFCCSICLYCSFFIILSTHPKSPVAWPEKYPQTTMPNTTKLDCWLHTVWYHFYLRTWPFYVEKKKFWSKYFKLGFICPEYFLKTFFSPISKSCSVTLVVVFKRLSNQSLFTVVNDTDLDRDLFTPVQICLVLLSVYIPCW